MIDTPLNQILGERLVDAREASHCLNLPIHWLTHTKERRRLGLPHYRVGKLLRFKLQELQDWMQARQDAAQQEDSDAGF